MNTDNLFNAPSKILLNMVNGDYGQNMARRMRSTYDTISTAIKMYEREGLITTTVFGRVKRVTFTDKGLKVRAHLRQIRHIFGSGER